MALVHTDFYDSAPNNHFGVYAARRGTTTSATDALARKLMCAWNRRRPRSKVSPGNAGGPWAKRRGRQQGPVAVRAGSSRERRRTSRHPKTGMRFPAEPARLRRTRVCSSITGPDPRARVGAEAAGGAKSASDLFCYTGRLFTFYAE